MNILEKNISISLNQIAIKNKLIFYFFRVFTFTGEWWMYLFYALLTILIDFDKGIEAIKFGIIAYGLHYPIYYLIKNTIKRKRPFVEYEEIKALVKPPDKYSLPSGHAAGTCISSLITMSIFEGIDILIIWPIIVSISRVFLGVHYITDSLLGLILGYGCFHLAKFIIF
jgi:undecaprenyl-diphosphatase